MLASLGRHADAVTCLDRAIALEPLNATALTHRGVALHAIGRYEDALRDYDRALAVDPDRAETLANRAAVLHAMLRFEGALASCDAALRISPDHVEALANRGAARARPELQRGGSRIVRTGTRARSKQWKHLQQPGRSSRHARPA